MKSASLRLRLTLWYSFALVVVLCLFAADVVWVQGRLGVRHLDQELDGLATTSVNDIRHELREQESLVAAADVARRTRTLPGSAIAVIDGAGHPIAAQWAGLDLKDPLPTVNDAPRTWTTETPAGAWRIHTQPEVFDEVSVVLLTASPLTGVRRGQREVFEAMELAIPLMLLVAAGGGFWLASVGLRPITEMASRAARIPLTGSEDLGHTERTDELGQLARAFNALVARLRTALRTQQQFMADASHELRTPVSVMRAAADVALSRGRREEFEYRESLGIVRDESRRLSRLVANMLVLARADAGGYPLRPIELDLGEVVADCCRMLRPLSAERQVTIRRAPAAGEIAFHGDEDLLRQLVLNVVQNAVQHTPAGGAVSIGVSQDSRQIVIRVSDGGPGIPEIDQSRIFDRFVQLDDARRGAGAGLGLPISRWIAEAHGGTLSLERSGSDGSTFSIALPVAVGASGATTAA